MDNRTVETMTPDEFAARYAPAPVAQATPDDYFIVISGEKGMYVEGTVSELELETIKV